MALAVIGFRFLLAFVFLLASVPKLFARDDLELAISNYAVLPRLFVRPASFLLPLVELGCAGALLVGAGTVLAALATAALLLAFAVGAAINLSRGRNIDCGCAGLGAPRHISWQLVARNIILAAFAAAVAAFPPKGVSVAWASWPVRPHGVVSESDSAAMVIAAAVTLVAVAVIADAVRLRRAGTRSSWGVSTP